MDEPAPPPQIDAIRRAGPSQVLPGDRYTVRLYLQQSADAQVFDNCKHVFWQNDNTVLVILQMFEDGTHRYMYWPREVVLWYQVTTSRHESIRRARMEAEMAGEGPQ